jgi:hypothetical protein
MGHFSIVDTIDKHKEAAPLPLEESAEARVENVVRSNKKAGDFIFSGHDHLGCAQRWGKHA